MKTKIILLFIAILLIVFKSSAQKTTTFVDKRDGTRYKSVKIGSQVWMAENVNFKTDSGSCCYGYQESNCKIYGRLYTWETARSVCPKGWHLPTITEWDTLVKYLGGNNEAGVRLRAEAGWKTDHPDKINSTGFSALPGGNHSYDSTFCNLGLWGWWWSSTGNGTENGWSRDIYFKWDSFIGLSDYYKGMYFSVRCIKD